MRIFSVLILGLFLVVLTTACATKTDNEMPRVRCPACDSEFDAIIHKRF